MRFGVADVAEAAGVCYRTALRAEGVDWVYGDLLSVSLWVSRRAGIESPKNTTQARADAGKAVAG